jgi:hypothetical protein
VIPIPPFLANFALEQGFKLGRGVVIALIIGALYAAGGLGFWRGMKTIERMQTTAASAATEAEKARGQAAIEKSNAEAAAIIAARDIAAARRDAAATQTISGLQSALTDWETRNAQTPGGSTQILDPGERVDLNRLRRRSGASATPDNRRRAVGSQ